MPTRSAELGRQSCQSPPICLPPSQSSMKLPRNPAKFHGARHQSRQVPLIFCQVPRNLARSSVEPGTIRTKIGRFPVKFHGTWREVPRNLAALVRNSAELTASSANLKRPFREVLWILAPHPQSATNLPAIPRKSMELYTNPAKFGRFSYKFYRKRREVPRRILFPFYIFFCDFYFARLQKTPAVNRQRGYRCKDS